MKKSSSTIKAFSLIEVSVVILIVGIFVAGIFVANKMVAKFRITSARALTQSSPISGIKDSALWLESSSEGSFANPQNETGATIASWNDLNPTAQKTTVTAVGTGATYSNSINYIHAVKFSGSALDHLQIADASFLNNTDYTIFVLEKTLASSGSNYFLGANSTNPNDKLQLGYSNNSTVVHNQGSNQYSNPALVGDYSGSGGKGRMFTFVQSSSLGKRIYVNGVLAAQSNDTAQLSGLTGALEIGKSYNGEIGELAIFTRALDNEERRSVEDYYAKKWSLKVNRASAPAGSCIGYTVTESGCDTALAVCSTGSTIGINTQNVNPGTGSLNCNGTNFDNTATVTYSCSGGSFSLTGGTTCANRCNSGYTYSGGACTLSVPYTSPCSSVNENGSLVMTAPAGKVWQSVNFASYGTPNSCVQGGCHAATSAAVVAAACIGQSTCTIGATNGAFDDPCSGTVKRLHVIMTAN
ncbi:MAG: prepilin-type N-terminal cleavage/methylation domain-containing protein [Rickettsiales bacterium]|nr:prepilin-type N-terminal cleavage/methylation domain-containing protein [Rickettsiales bacterium]